MAATANVFVNAKTAGRQPCDARTQQERQQLPRSNALTQPHRIPQRRQGKRFKRFAHTPYEKDGHSLRIFFQSKIFCNLKKSLAIPHLLCGIFRFSLLLSLDKQTHTGVYTNVNMYICILVFSLQSSSYFGKVFIFRLFAYSFTFTIQVCMYVCKYSHRDY